MTRAVGRGELWRIDRAGRVLVLSSTVYNDIPSEPTVLVVPVLDFEPDTGFGVALTSGADRSPEGWAAPGLITSLRKTRLSERLGAVDVQTLTEVNTMLFRILATPDR